MNTFSNQLDLAKLMTPLDWTIFAIVLLLTAASVIFGNRQKKSQIKSNTEEESFLDLLIMGRKLTLPLFIGTLVATWYGGIIGVTQIAFNKGIYNFITQGAFWYISYIIFALFIVHKVQAYKAVTLPNLIEKMFGKKSSILCGIFNFFNVLPIVYVISLGLFLQILFGGTLVFNMVMGVGFVVLYSMWGGFRAVVFSDIIQFIVMCSAVAIVLIMSISQFGGIEFLQANLPESYFSPTGDVGWPTTIVWGFIALSTLVDPNFYQRCFAADSPKTAKRGILISTFIWFLFDICTTFGAMYAKAIIPEAESSQAYILYAAQLMPSGLRGFMLAGLLATILSTIDSYLFIAGTTLSFDLAPKRFRGKVILHHLSIVVVGIIAVIMAVVFDGNIKSVWKTLGSYSAACMLLPVIYGYLFPTKIKDYQFVASSIMGAIAVTYWRSTSHTGFWNNVDELYIGVLATSLALLFYPLLPIKQRLQ